jgi:thymidylate synthase (FAD)
MPTEQMREELNAIEHSGLLDDLAWTHFHHSILEHANLSYLVRGTSRGVLQEHARHRLQAISVRSTRYTMSGIINAFVASQFGGSKEFFIQKVLAFDMFVTANAAYNALEIGAMYDKLAYQKSQVEDFYSIAVAKSSLEFLESFKDDAEALYEALQAGKKKRNVGDAFKHIITDNVKVDMVVTFNLRSLKNYFALRDSGAAFFQIRWLAQEMTRVTPKKYLDLIIKNKQEK